MEHLSVRLQKVRTGAPVPGWVLDAIATLKRFYAGRLPDTVVEFGAVHGPTAQTLAARHYLLCDPDPTVAQQRRVVRGNADGLPASDLLVCLDGTAVPSLANARAAALCVPRDYVVPEGFMSHWSQGLGDGSRFRILERCHAFNLAVVAPFYNPRKWHRRIDNYIRFRNNLLRQGVPLWTVEHVLDNQEPQLAQLVTGEQYILVRGGADVWQKEALLNYAFARVPAHYDALAWVDADTLFLRDSWRHEAEQRLETHAAVQLFREVHMLSAAGEAKPHELVRDGGAWAYANGGWAANVGHAWAYRRVTWQLIGGFYSKMIVGGGDGVITLAAYGPSRTHPLTGVPPRLRDDAGRWVAQASHALKRNTTWLPGAIRHLWHGEHRDRGYHTRNAATEAFDPVHDLAVGASGVLEWQRDKPALRKALTAYYKSRREDGRRKIDNGRFGVLTSADSVFFPGLSRLVDSLRLVRPGVPIAVVDLGLSDDQRQWLRRRSVHTIYFDQSRFAFDKPALPIRDRLLWLKPTMFAASPFARTLWLDSDTLLLRDLDEIEDILASQPVLTLDINPQADNSPALYATHPCPEWSSQPHGVNSGVVGLALPRDMELLRYWRFIADRAIADNGVRQLIRLHDQGSLLWALRRCGLSLSVLPSTYNKAADYVSYPATLPALEAVRSALPGVRVAHFMGVQGKPWLQGPFPATFDGDIQRATWDAGEAVRLAERTIEDRTAYYQRQLKRQGLKQVLFMPWTQEFGTMLMFWARFVEAVQAERKIVCCAPSDRLLFPSAHEFVDWTNPLSDTLRGPAEVKGLKQLRAQLQTLAGRYPEATVMPAVTCDYHAFARRRVHFVQQPRLPVTLDAVLAPRFREHAVQRNWAHWQWLADQLESAGYRVGAIGQQATSVDLRCSYRSWDQADQTATALAMLQQGRLYIGSDSGASHLAVLCRAPSLLFRDLHDKRDGPGRVDILRDSAEAYWQFLDNGWQERELVLAAALAYLQGDDGEADQTIRAAADGNQPVAGAPDA